MTPDFFRARLGEMVNPKDPMVILSRQMPWEDIEAYLSRFFVRTPEPGRVVVIDDLFGTTAVCQGGGPTLLGGLSNQPIVDIGLLNTRTDAEAPV